MSDTSIGKLPKILNNSNTKVNFITGSFFRSNVAVRLERTVSSSESYVHLDFNQNASDIFGQIDVQITDLPNYKLNQAIHIRIEPDENGYIAKTTDFPIYAFDDNRKNAIKKLKLEIETLYDDLIEDDNFTDEWLDLRNQFVKLISPT